MKKTSSNQSIDRMFRILETLAVTGRAMRLNDIAEKSSVSASTAMRILNAMIENGYVYQNPETQLYGLTYKLLWAGTAIRENLSLNQLLHPYLAEIARQTGLSSALSVRNGDAVTFVDEVVSTSHMVRIYHHLGQSFPLYSTASGKVFLSGMPQEERERYYKANHLVPVTPKTLYTPQALETAMEKIQSLGYAVDDEEALLGMRCVALPVNISNGEVFAVISISGTIYQVTAENIPLLAATIQNVLAKPYEECRPVFSQLQASELL